MSDKLINLCVWGRVATQSATHSHDLVVLDRSRPRSVRARTGDARRHLHHLLWCRRLRRRPAGACRDLGSGVGAMAPLPGFRAHLAASVPPADPESDEAEPDTPTLTVSIEPNALNGQVPLLEDL